MKNKAIILCRISDLKQDDGYSLDAQEKYAKEYCDKNHYKILKTFRFVETGSKSHKRQKFDSMMDYLKTEISKANKEPIRLIVEKPDRLTRNFTNKEQLQFFVMTGKLEIHYYKDRRIFDKNCTPSDIFTDDMMTSVSKYIALNIARETHKGMKQKAESGWFLGHAPLGYKNVRVGSVDKNGRKEARIEVYEKLKPAVLRIFELRATKKMSYQAIKEKILEENLLPSRKARSFSKSSAEKVLKNSFYSGNFEWKGEVFKGKHEVFIPKAWLNKVNDFRGTPLTNKFVGPFSSFLKCGVEGCGSTIIYDPKTKTRKDTGKKTTYHYYHCADGRRFHKENGIKQINANEDKIWAQFEQAVDRVHLPEELAEDIFKAIKENEKKYNVKEIDETKLAKEKLEDLAFKKEELYEHFTKELLDEETYRKKLKEVQIKKISLEKELSKPKRIKNESFLKSSEDLLELAKELKSLWKCMESKDKLSVLKKLCSNPTLDGLSVDYRLRKPFEILEKIKDLKEKSEWCPWRESNPHALRH